MTSICCPSCSSDNIKVLGGVSPDPGVVYHRCPSCGHVWVTFTDGRATHDVTPLMRESKAS
jgi:transposase-like protein